jgi:uncharacterized repeat protein (TIGR01451 family)
MKQTVSTLLACALALTGSMASAAKLDELQRPRDFTRDFQVPAAPTGGLVTVLTQDFNGAFPPAGWTVVNNAPGGPVWGNLAGCGESGNFTNGSGDVACVSSDVFGAAEFDVELRTSAINLSAFGAPAALTFTANYQNFANLDFFTVDVSTNGGGAWTNLLSWNEDHGGFRAAPGENVNLDISAYAGQADVRFRFRYFDPNTGDFDWYAQVDNVAVAATPAVPTISLEATVGTTPGACATTDTLTVTAGTEVHYCYEVTNTGAIALNSHDLSDTLNGTILNDFPFNLLPGASAFLVVPATPSATVTNTGTWTATTGSTYTVDTAAPFNYIPINATGTALNLTDDSEANIVSPFPITFNGVTSTNLRVGNNGGILFNATTGDVGFGNAVLPNAAHPVAIFPFWDDMDDETGNVYWQVQGAAPNRQLIVEWFDRPHFNNTGAATFQVVISEGSNQIRFQYLDVDFGNAGFNNGASATVGLNFSATSAQQVSFNTATLANGQAILFTPPQSATATDSTTVTVLIPNIDVSPASLTAGAPVNQTTTAPLTIANTGQGDLNWAITEEPVGQPQTTPAGRGSAADARDEVSESLNKTEEPTAAVPASGPIWRAPAAVLFDNGPLVTDPGAGAGGADVSALQLTQSTLGFGHAVTSGFRMADDFVVGGSGWLINTVTFFAYQTGSTTTSTIDAVNVRIWDGPPGAPGSNVVFGDTTTNRLLSTAYTNIFRTASTPLTGTTRPIMANTVTINTFLPAGTYWFDWQTGGTLASGPWAPAVTLVGQLAKPGANALQFDPGAMTWGPAIDTGAAAQQDLPFVIDGLADCANPSDVPWLSLSQTAGTNVGGTSTVITATFDATGLAVGNYSARLCATSNDPDAGPGNGTGLVIVPVSFNVAASADLVMTLTAAPDPVTAGTNLVYTGTVTNNGPTAANNVSFSLPLPANTSFVSATASAGGACAGNPVVCTWAGSTAVGASNSASITVLVAPSVLQGATLTATATATSADFDPNLANNAATATTGVIASADLQVSLTSSVTSSPINVPVTFTATSLNLGPSDAQDVSVTITLTPDFRYSSHSAAGATCTVPQVGNTGAIVCTWAGATAPGASRTLSVVAFSNVQGPTAVNASTTSSTTDPVPGNNSTTVTVQVGYLVEEIPTLGNLGLLLMALMMGLMGFVAVRRQS